VILVLITAASFAAPGWVGVCENRVLVWDDSGSLQSFRTPFRRSKDLGELSGPVYGMVPFQGACILHHGVPATLSRLDAARWKLAPVSSSVPPEHLAYDPTARSLVLVESGTSARWVEALEETADGWGVPLADGLDPRRLAEMYTLPFDPVDVRELPEAGLLLVGPDRIAVLNRRRYGRFALTITPTVVRPDTVWMAGEDRFLLVDESGETAERYSLLAPVAPLPLASGMISIPSEMAPWMSIPVGPGAWLPDPGPLRRVAGLDGIKVGMPEGELPILVAASGATTRGPGAVFVLEDGSISLVSAPPIDAPIPLVGTTAFLKEARWADFGDAVEASVAAEAYADRAVHLARGTGAITAHRRAESMMASAGAFDLHGLEVADAYLDAFPDSALETRAADLRMAIDGQLMLWRIAIFLGMIIFGFMMRRRWNLSREASLALTALYNPFRQDSPNQAAFTPFAAQDLVDDVLRALDLNCVMLEAPSLSGKTSLLRHLAWRLESEGLGARPCVVVSADLHGVEEARFWALIGRAVAEAYPSEAATEVLELEPDEYDRATVEYLLNEVLVEGAPRLVLVLDNFDVLGLYKAEAQRFRGLIQVVPSHSMAVLAAGGSIRRGWSGHADESPWFNIFQVRKMEPMTVEQIRAYLSARLARPFAFHAAVPERLHRITEGRALQVWHVCFAAVETLLVERRLTLTLGDLEGATNDVRDIGMVFASGRDTDRDWAWGLFELKTSPEQVVRMIGEARARRDQLQLELVDRES